MSAEAGATRSGGADEHVRRVRLPADRRTPAAARAVVRTMLLEARLPELLNEALLLTTELTTNAVEHARTELDIEVEADPNGLTVTVTDFASGPVDELIVGVRNTTSDIAEVATRGRGLLLVDHFSSRWGTTYLPTGKGVWFRLDRPGPGGPARPSAGPPPVTEPERTGDSAPSAAAMSELMQITPDPYADEPLAEFATGLLTRVGEMVGAAGGTVRLDRGDGLGTQMFARYGRQPREDNELLRVPLAVHRPYTGELELDAAPSTYARPLAVLAAERLSLHLENDRLRRADVRRSAWLTFLAEASELLAQSLDVELTMALIPQLVVPRLGQWCAVHTTDEWGRLRLAASSHADEAMLPQLHRILQETGPDSLQSRLREASRSAAQVPFGGPMEGFAVPLIARGQRLGTLAVGRHQRHRHDPDEVSVLEDVARRAALAIENARIHAERRRVAQTLQQSLLPPVLPVVEGIGFAAEYVPTGDDAEVGGDFYDVVPLPDGRWLVVVGDVSGKGVQAAAVTGLVRDVIRVLVGDGKPLPEVLSRLNETLVERGGGRYCTLALAAVSPGDGDQLDVSLHLAGHDRPVLLHGGGGATFIGTGGTALGLLDAISTPTAELALKPGDALIFYTDGVTERRRGRELFGTERLRESAAPLAGYSADVVAARLRAATIAFSVEPPRDDIAILVLRNDTP
ncbi:SpoIIE family protein phosphatase [Micromonospora echinospora]|uniref:Serine phosphatase RsbU (Regulator of sigma subunit)/anti-sigma regulatory factor (Ser/Thr protein kinase) n=1 Tax=Micromonospora echinospora TaxID=1877 RepID=A0ABR6M8N1_MICEC|nr:SpoIIE family protein phosphatase [Micromonospora echinospora]MBB5111035.1 serine phosphatase RsbU (regulator of sigma subunit)/anti-sigma regulatory factor (Ser/Thr protein kinase) [Micromonospora echinospora]